jgi:hypothetical protein
VSAAVEVEVVRGRVDEELGTAITDFWTQRGPLAAEAARERLAEVVCVLRSPDGKAIGVNSAHAANVPMVGGRLFWIYRAALADAATDEDLFAMLGACFEALAEEFAAAKVGPVGVCLFVDDVAMLERNPEAIWPEVGFLHAGFAPDGTQLRLRYFEDARI